MKLASLSLFLSLSTLFSLYAVSQEVKDEDWTIQFHKLGQSVNPVLGPIGSTSFKCPVRKKLVLWEEKDVFNPAAVVKDGLVYLLYRAEDRVGSLSGTSRIGIAWSEDGITFNHRLTTPVLYPAIDRYNKYEWEGGCEDPRVVEIPSSLGGGYLMTYTSYDGTARLSVATSKDLFTWKKYGPAFGKAFGGSYLNAWTKSGSIVVEPQQDGRLVAVMINGSYWMYWGENDLHIAKSTDLINWTPVMAENPDAVYRGRPDHLDIPTNAKKPLSVLRPRRGKFDSNLVEPGPPALLRPDGIFFIYNSKNTACHENLGHLCANGEADPNLAPGTYSAGQVLFSREDPTQVLRRTENTFFKPTESFEITGQVGNVCFLEGLIFFNDKWLLYYGTADSKIAVAEAAMYDYRGMFDQRAKARKEEAIAVNARENEEEVFHHTLPRIHQDFLNRVHHKLQEPPKEISQEEPDSLFVKENKRESQRQEEKEAEEKTIEVSESESQASGIDVVVEEL